MSDHSENREQAERRRAHAGGDATGPGLSGPGLSGIGSSHRSMRQTRPNPYAPTAMPLRRPGTPRVARLELPSVPVAFEGELTWDDLVRVLAEPGWQIRFGVGVLLLVGGLSALLAGIGMGGAELLVVLWLGLGCWGLGAHQMSGRRRAYRHLRQSPHTLGPRSGELTREALILRAPERWYCLPWQSVIGVRLQRDVIGLALDPQHAGWVVLPRRFFAAEDWSALRLALGDVAQQLPWHRAARDPDEAERLVDGALPSWDVVPEPRPSDAIGLRGRLHLGDIATSRFVWQLCRPALFAVLLALLGVLAMRMAFGSSVMGWVLVAMLLLTSTLGLVRIGRFLYQVAWHGQQPVLRMEAWVAESGLWLATPRGVGLSRWSEFGDCVVGDEVLLLRQSPSSRMIVALAKRMLVDPEQWDQLVTLVSRSAVSPTAETPHQTSSPT